MRLYGRDWTKRELEERVGQIEQLGGIRRMRLTEGAEAGVEWIQVRTGGGLTYYINASKGLDISLAEFGGTPISWQSPNGDAHPAYYDSSGEEWLRTASGGLLMTCGLMHVGSPSEDESGRHGQHGRIHHTPAKQVGTVVEWIGDELELRVTGVVQETTIFGGKLRLSRTFRSRLGENRIEITDHVENIGFKPCPHMILYHFNFGFPLLDEKTTFRFPQAELSAVNHKVPPAGHDRWSAPSAACEETVYYHRLRPEAADEQGMAEAEIFSPSFPVGGRSQPLSVRLRWTTATLPRLVQWRMPGAGEHVLGLEPANCGVEGRASETADGGIRILAPGETVSYKLELILDGKHEKIER
ncbi:DUF4432 family protein [Paenibacillaceae bacterium]|nr:DUF4432 family protein [Paenibacillaceae bacterium]